MHVWAHIYLESGSTMVVVVQTSPPKNPVELAGERQQTHRTIFVEDLLLVFWCFALCAHLNEESLAPMQVIATKRVIKVLHNG